MTDDELAWVLQRLHRRRPFRSDWIELVTGDRLLVSHPESVVWQGGIFLYRDPDFSQRIFGVGSVCQLIEQLLPPPAPSTS